MDVRHWVGLGLGGLAVVVAGVSLLLPQGDAGAGMGANGMPAGEEAYAMSGPADGSQGQAMPASYGNQGQAEQALQGLIQIRQQQCQMGNQLACQVLPQMPAYSQQLQQHGQGCQQGNQQACSEYQALSQKIMTAYSESAAVMQAGEQGMAQMNAWRAQMNQNAANSMQNLQAQAAAGQAAHNARQDSYAAQNRAWAAGQASGERNQGRFVDGIYEGTTMSGGGVQARVDYGSTGYTDGNGNVVSVPNGTRPPDGYTEMTPTYAAPR